MYKFTKLSNGLPVIISPMRGTKTATVLFIVGTGSKYENKINSGISHFVEHMMFKGTKKRPNSMAITTELDAIGSENNAFTDKENTGYYVKAESDQIEIALDVLSDMIMNSKFDAKEIKKEKGVITEELNMYLDNPIMYIEDLFETCLYGNTPAGWDIVGTKKTIANFKRTDFIKYWKTQYGTKSSLLCVAGNTKTDIIKLVNKYFGRMTSNNFNDKIGVVEKQEKPEIKLHYKQTDQAHLSLGVRSYRHDCKDKIVLKVLASILGGSMSSRMFSELREKRGLAYYVKTFNQTYTDTSYLTTQAGVPIDKINEAIKIILGEYSKLISTGKKNRNVNTKELNRVKEFLIGRFALQSEPSDAMANWYGRQGILNIQTGQPIMTPEKYYSEVKKVTIKDILRVAKDIFTNQKLNLAIIGPYKNRAKFEKILSL